MKNPKHIIKNIVTAFFMSYSLYCAIDVLINGVERSCISRIETLNIALGIISIITILIIAFNELVEFLTSE